MAKKNATKKTSGPKTRPVAKNVTKSKKESSDSKPVVEETTQEVEANPLSSKPKEAGIEATKKVSSGTPKVSKEALASTGNKEIDVTTPEGFNPLSSDPAEAGIEEGLDSGDEDVDAEEAGGELTKEAE